MSSRPTLRRPKPAASALRTLAKLTGGAGRDARRLQLALAVSVLLHALVLSISFTLPARPPNRDSGLEVVLVNARHARAPDKADALAQANVDGGGNSDRQVRPKTPLPAQEVRRDGNAPVEARKRVAPPAPVERRVLTQPKAATAVSRPPPRTSETPPAPAATPSGLDLLNSAATVARLEAEIGRQLDDYAKRPRKKFIGARTKEYRFAQYVEDWRHKIERVGTLNYPEAARGRLYGSLLLVVAIRADGSIERVEIQRSSGEPVLDEAAKRIVRLAAPFAPFPGDIRSDTDILEIARTWTFTNADKVVAQ